MAPAFAAIESKVIPTIKAAVEEAIRG
jgi:hypothetical protein